MELLLEGVGLLLEGIGLLLVVDTIIVVLDESSTAVVEVDAIISVTTEL